MSVEVLIPDALVGIAKWKRQGDVNEEFRMRFLEGGSIQKDTLRITSDVIESVVTQLKR